MHFNEHYKLRDLHSFLSPSTYHWINYTEEKLVDRYLTHQAAARGTRLHALAEALIQEKVKLPDNTKTLNAYVNDAIGFRMDTEQILYYSENCFGTTDAISFRNNQLRIHDLKNGVTPAHINQLRVYAAIFCLEYNYKPSEIDIELRIYQNDEIVVDVPDPIDILFIMDRIKVSDQIIRSIKEEDLA